MNRTVIAVASVVMVAGGMAAVSGQVKDDPSQHMPGLMSQARMLVLNHGPQEAIPVTIETGAELLRVQVSNVPVVRTMRQAWEYERIIVPVGEDPTPRLNAAGQDGWETTGVSITTPQAVQIVMKRQSGK